MNAHDQIAIALKLEQALAHFGILVEQPAVTTSGNVRAWQPVMAVHIVGALAAKGWKVQLADQPAFERTPLHLVRPDGHRDGTEL